MTFTGVTRALYAALKAMPCRCEYARNKRGVPEWEGVPLTRQLLKRCSRCAATEEYEELMGIDPSVEKED